MGEVPNLRTYVLTYLRTFEVTKFKQGLAGGLSKPRSDQESSSAGASDQIGPYAVSGGPGERSGDLHIGDGVPPAPTVSRMGAHRQFDRSLTSR